MVDQEGFQGTAVAPLPQREPHQRRRRLQDQRCAVAGPSDHHAVTHPSLRNVSATQCARSGLDLAHTSPPTDSTHRRLHRVGLDGGVQQLKSSRGFCARAFRFAVGAPSQDLIDLIEELFCDLPEADPSDSDVTRFVLVPSNAPDRYSLLGPVIGPPASLPLPGAIALLVTSVSRGSLDAEPERLHLHAAGAVRHGRAALLAAPRETGKTTTLATLVHRGWGFISDEAISLAAGDDKVRGFPKPLSIKPHGRDLVSHLTSRLLPPGDMSADAVLHVSLGPTGATAYPSAEPHYVGVLVRSREPGPSGQLRSRPLHPVDAVVALMAETMDAGRFGPDALLLLARLTSRCRCDEITVGEPAETARLIERLFDQAPTPPLPVEVLENGTSIRPNVRSVMIGDRVVIHEQPEGRILALDEPGSQVWLKIGGWAPAPDIDLDGPVVSRFVQQLEALGLHERSSTEVAPENRP